MKFMFFSIIKYRYSDILLNNHKIHYAVDKAFEVIRIMYFNRTGPSCYSTIFLTLVPGNKMELFRT